jgi:hypothetical protein
MTITRKDDDLKSVSNKCRARRVANQQGCGVVTEDLLAVTAVGYPLPVAMLGR